MQLKQRAWHGSYVPVHSSEAVMPLRSQRLESLQQPMYCLLKSPPHHLDLCPVDLRSLHLRVGNFPYRPCVSPQWQSQPYCITLKHLKPAHLASHVFTLFVRQPKYVGAFFALPLTSDDLEGARDVITLTVSAKFISLPKMIGYVSETLGVHEKNSLVGS